MMPLHELAGDAHSIFIGTVTSVDVVKRNGYPRTIVDFEVVGRVSGPMPRRRNQQSRFDQLGGEIDGESLSHAHQPVWEIGESYLVFQSDPADGGMHMVHGGEAGYYRLVQDSLGDRVYPVDAHGRPIVGLHRGGFDLARPAVEIRDGVATLTEAEPFFDAPVAPGGQKGTVATFDEKVEVLDLDEVVALVRETLGLGPKPAPKPSDVGYPLAGTAFSRGLGLCACGYHRIPLVYQQVYTSWACYDNNNWSMAEFNYYLALHQYIPTDGGWNAPNGTDELAGFTTSSTLNAVYGPGSGWGGSTLAVNWSWSGSGCSRVTEADIHMNPAVSWRYDFDDAFNGVSGEIFYDTTMMHEMGHSLGLERKSCNEDYMFDRPTIMSAGGNWFVETGRGLHRRDAALLRTVYDENENEASTINRTDMGVESWYMDGSIRNGDIAESTVKQGEKITMRNLLVENVSTWDVSNVRIRGYFSRNTTISEADYRSDTPWYEFSDFCFNCDWRGDLEWDVPSDIPPGDYYVGVIVTYNGASYSSDAVWGNNKTFFPDKVTITEADPPTWSPSIILLDRLFYTQFYANTAAAANDGPPPANCPGAGPDQAFAFTARVRGKFELSPADFAVGESLGEQRVITSACTPNNEIIAVNCDTSATNPLVFDVEPGTEYRLRVYTTDDRPVEGWFNGRLVPEIEFGSAPSVALEWTQSQDQQSSQVESGGPYQLPCSGPTDFGRWYVYTPPVTGRMTASTCGVDTTFPSVISIHKAAPDVPLIGCGTWQESDCPETFGAVAFAEVEAGSPVLVRVASQDNPGQFSLSIDVNRSDSASLKCDTAQPVDQPGLYRVSGYGSFGDPLADCEGVVAPRQGTWLDVRVDRPSELLVTPCADLGGDARSRMSVFIFEGDCSALRPVACNNFVCSEGGAVATVQAGNYKVFLETDYTSDVVVDIKESPCAGDVNGDRRVDSADLGLLLGRWGVCGGCPEDLNGDGIVNAADLGLVLAAFGPCP
ncbi:MAG: hypothetical protein VX672_04090 [Planctomycetota bacterium]|nr:hypothetical protein [Planctomycetota bacterium]